MHMADNLKSSSFVFEKSLRIYYVCAPFEKTNESLPLDVPETFYMRQRYLAKYF